MSNRKRFVPETDGVRLPVVLRDADLLAMAPKLISGLREYRQNDVLCPIEVKQPRASSKQRHRIHIYLCKPAQASNNLS